MFKSDAQGKLQQLYTWCRKQKVMRKDQFHLTSCHSKNSVFDYLFILKLDIFSCYTIHYFMIKCETDESIK